MIDYRNVTIQLGDRTVISHANLKVGARDFVYLIGPVGSGKTSLLRTFYHDLNIAEADTARVLDFDLMHMKRGQVPLLRRGIGVVFQEFKLLNDRTVGENLDFVLRATGWKKKSDRQDRIKEVLADVRMEDKVDCMPYCLSGGEKQRIVIARALLNRPKLILADEPVSHLDALTAHQVLELLHRVCREHGAACVMSTHNTAYPLIFAGRIVKVTETGELTEESQNEASPDLTDNNSADAHCSQPDNLPEEQCCSEQSDQTPSESE